MMAGRWLEGERDAKKEEQVGGGEVRGEQKGWKTEESKEEKLMHYGDYSDEEDDDEGRREMDNN